MNLQNIESKVPIFNFAFGLIVVLGGAFGFIKAQSIPSLAAGLAFGNLLMLSIWGVKEKSWGYYLADLVSISLLIFFILRLIKTGSPMPAIPIIVLAIIGVILNTFILHQKSLKK